MIDLSFVSLGLIGFCAFLIGFSKTSVGGLGIVSVPLIALAVPGPESTGLLLPILVIADLAAVFFYHRGCDWNIFRKIFPITAIGVVIGYFVMDSLPRDVFSSVLGGIILVMLLIGWGLERRPVLAIGNNFLTWVVGVCAGISTMVANAAGPLLGIYLLQQGLPKNNFVGTRSVYFLLLNLFKIPFSASLGFITVSSLKINLATIPIIALGAIAGVQLLKIINVMVFKWVIRGAATISAIKLLVG